MSVIRKSKESSTQKLLHSLAEFTRLLETQKEDEAVVDLRQAANTLRDGGLKAPESQQALQTILEAFDGDHELIDYINKTPDAAKWNTSEELYLSGSNVYSLTKRLLRNFQVS